MRNVKGVAVPHAIAAQWCIIENSRCVRLAIDLWMAVPSKESNQSSAALTNVANIIIDGCERGARRENEDDDDWTTSVTLAGNDRSELTYAFGAFNIRLESQRGSFPGRVQAKDHTDRHPRERSANPSSKTPICTYFFGRVLCFQAFFGSHVRWSASGSTLKISSSRGDSNRARCKKVHPAAGREPHLTKMGQYQRVRQGHATYFSAPVKTTAAFLENSPKHAQGNNRSSRDEGRKKEEEVER